MSEGGNKSVVKCVVKKKRGEEEKRMEAKIKYSEWRKNEAAKNQSRNNKEGTHPHLIGLHLFLLSLSLI